MIAEYNEEDFLALSGIQHFVFCRRQWALIHIEQQWEDNVRTVEGNMMHERAHDKMQDETRNGVRTVRGMPVHSCKLGIYGICDVVELRPDGAVPIEYKKGTPKESDADVMQLVLQVICLEEMLGESILAGYLYYGETRHRLRVELTDELRDRAQKLTSEMHDYFDRGYTPKVKPAKRCNACSLKNVCLPKLYGVCSVSSYIKENIEGLTDEKVAEHLICDDT